MFGEFKMQLSNEYALNSTIIHYRINTTRIILEVQLLENN